MGHRLPHERGGPTRRCRARQAGTFARLAALMLVGVVLVVTTGAFVACGDGSAPVPSTRTLSPEQSPSSGKHGATTAPPVQPPASTTPSATTSPAPTASSTPARVTDKSIRAGILARIAQEPGLRGFEIKVVVGDRVVYLRGRVRSKEQRALIEQIALTEPGVKKVISAIDVDDAAGY